MVLVAGKSNRTLQRSKELLGRAIYCFKIMVGNRVEGTRRRGSLALVTHPLGAS